MNQTQEEEIGYISSWRRAAVEHALAKAMMVTPIGALLKVRTE